VTHGQLTFEIVHALRVRGLADSESLVRATGGADIGTELADMSGQELVASRDVGGRTRWMLLPAGLVWHERELAGRRDGAFAAAVESGYRKFLSVNRPMKELCTDWQAAGSPEEGADAVVAELRELTDAARAALGAAAAAASWFALYPPRLQDAVSRFAAGERQFLISPHVDSFHTIWGECHEDFLVSLGLERGEQDE
jgi:hypothetical protein